MSNSNRRGVTLGIMITVLAVLLAACGSGGTGEGDSDGIASVGTDTTAVEDEQDSSSDGVEAPTDRNEAFVLYDQCMADEGFPTDAAGQANDSPSVQGGSAGGSEGEGPTELAIGPGGIEIAPEDMEAFETANQVCQAHLANITQGEEFTPEQQAALDDANLRVQQCLADKGVEGQFSIGGGDDGGVSQSEESNEDTPPPNQGDVDPEEVEAAMAECMKIFDEYPELADVLPSPPGS